ncbi:hypothetical protein FQN54_007447 [Arachnomyces sp. PD_36]|nr:hypothetical protein FQN54_007447 [Arachnomyces sp. PD_36]
MHIKASSVLGAVAALPLAALAQSSSSSSNDACGRIGSFAENVPSSAGGLSGIPAKLAHDCLTSTPLEKELAAGFVDQIKEYFEFQSTLAYLKDPPSDYKMPSIDVMGTLDDIKEQVLDGTLTNQHDFDAALLKLTYGVHDGHMVLFVGTIGAFIFQLPVSLVSVSEDGKKLPEIFILDDIQNSQSSDIDISPIDKINGQDAVDWLKEFAKDFSSSAVVEDHADFNGLMYSRARDISAGIEFSSSLAMQYLFPGEDFKGTFKNGTSFSYKYTATTAVDFAGVSSGEEFYEGYVRAQPSSTPSSSPEPPSAAGPDPSATPAPLHPVGAPYPDNPVVKQTDFFGAIEPWGVTGYHLPDEKIGVLVIPSFMAGSTTQAWFDFSQAVERFLSKSKDAGIEKIVIDLQGNGGGISFLGLDIFKQFFPDTEPYAGGRFRTHESGKILGNIFTSMARDEYVNPSLYSWSPWDEERWSDEDGNDFATWDDLYESFDIHDDTFTQVLRENLTHAYVDEEAYPITVYNYGPRVADVSQPYDAADIVLLQDGFCGSTCVLFADLMRVHHGVQSVAVGGIPEEGPMQGAAGTRGGLVYDFQTIIQDIKTAKARSPSEASNLPSVDFPYVVAGGGVNLRDQLHQDDDTPLQFQYLPSNCRIWYTPEMITDYTYLWKAAASAIWDEDSGLCVKDSVTEGPEPSNEDVSSSDSDNDGEDDEEDAASSVLLSRGLVVAVSLISTALIVL